MRNTSSLHGCNIYVHTHAHSNLAWLHSPQIRSVVWNADDSKLISCGTDGAVYEWNLSSGKRETECVLKSCSYYSVTISPDGKCIFAVGSDQTLKEIADSLVSLPPPHLRAAVLLPASCVCAGKCDRTRQSNDRNKASDSTEQHLVPHSFSVHSDLITLELTA